MKNFDLFCFPFAGGNKYSYRDFEEFIFPGVNMITMEYPGRGLRTKEEFMTNIDDLIDDLYIDIIKNIGKNEYAFYGHSMGGIMAFFLCKKLIAGNHKPPKHLFITGTTGPTSNSRREKQRHLMSKEAFIQEIRDLDGCPEEVLNNDELLDYFEPILRADFRISETFMYTTTELLEIPVTVITGTDEDLKMEDIKLWQKETTHNIDFQQMPGKHFFILDYPAEIMEIVTNKIYRNNIVPSI
ncbi:thioesterase domain-containing protein [Pedobacter sp. UYP1]|uniref:thioesterase II family protein n=1 Tax=Pedobacter sp. UYP1 TaxID=1756396 RepID=UPI00339791C4